VVGLGLALQAWPLPVLLKFVLSAGLSVLICLAEIVFGVLLIIGGKIKTVAYLTLFMMLFFTFFETCLPVSIPLHAVKPPIIR
jgi:uncharacterized membrane protein YphA (DoxX/SURF4 family)